MRATMIYPTEPNILWLSNSENISVGRGLMGEAAFGCLWMLVWCGMST